MPDDDEMLVGYVQGEATERTRNRYGQEFLDEPAYQRAVADTRGRRRHDQVIDSDRFGEVWVTVVPVRNAQGEGALVIVNFLADEHDELNSTLRTYALVALLSLGLITTIAAFQSGRPAGPACAPWRRPLATSPRPTCPAASPSRATTTSPPSPGRST